MLWALQKQHTILKLQFLSKNSILTKLFIILNFLRQNWKKSRFWPKIGFLDKIWTFGIVCMEIGLACISLLRKIPNNLCLGREEKTLLPFPSILHKFRDKYFHLRDSCNSIRKFCRFYWYQTRQSTCGIHHRILNYHFSKIQKSKKKSHKNLKKYLE